MALEKELATYSRKLAEIHEHMGKFVLIHGDDVVDYFSAYDDALKAGYQKFQLQPFLVRQITSEVQGVQHVTRWVQPYLQTRTV